MTLDIGKGADVYTARDEHAGKVERIVIDAVDRRVTHIVVRKGMLLREDKLIRFDDIATATPERVNLRQDVELNQLVPYVEEHYFHLDEVDLAEGELELEPFFATTWYGPPGIASPMYQDVMLKARERNIPERLTAIEAGVDVFASDGDAVGRLERVLATGEGLPTHLIIDSDAQPPGSRAVPIGWVGDVGEDAIMLGATARMVAAIEPLDPDETAPLT